MGTGVSDIRWDIRRKQVRLGGMLGEIEGNYVGGYAVVKTGRG